MSYHLELGGNVVANLSWRRPGRYNSRVTKAEPVIVADPEVMSGTPCFRGTRVPFKNLMDYLEGGHSLGEFLDQFPTVTHAMAIQALAEAMDRPVRGIRQPG